MLSVQKPGRICRPLDTVRVSAEGEGTFVVWDGEGREYARMTAGREVPFQVSGSLGTHVVLYLDDEGSVLDRTSFKVDCETELTDENGRFARLLDMLYDTMFQHWASGYTKYLRIEGKRYKYYVSWLRDHVHALKGMKYWDDDLKTGIELYADSQREDGMIWDKCKEMAHSYLQFWRDHEFAYGDFVRKIPGNPTRRWQRVPVENDVEFLYIEGLYYTWKACGDDDWMEGLLDSAIRAVRYSTSDIYRWSKKYQLLKRGYTIDTWDFQSKDDVKRSGSVMRVLPGKTEFNVFHGDNTGMSVSCRYLAEMLEVAGREREAEEFRKLSRALKERLDDLSWNGEFYTHMIPENPDAERDLGDTPTDRQVTLSNAYALNRRIEHEQCVAIIESYRRIREEMPESSAGEWYNCYPPFEKGFSRHTDWNYMNGGVSTICAGELAHGAFEHGYEDYAVNVLGRVIELGERLGGYLHNTFKGKLPDPPEDLAFTPVDLTEVANVDLHGEGAEGVPGWSGDPENDMCNLPTGQQTFAGVDFRVIDPAENDRRAVLGISSDPDYRAEETVQIGAKARTVYLLHGAQGGGLMGWMTVRYADGSHETQYIHTGQEIESWFMPAPDEVQGRIQREGPYRIGWQGPNRKFDNVGLFVYGWENPEPDREIESITFTAAETGAIWLVAGITLSDAERYFPVSIVSYGIPDMWGAAALVYALIEGLAGIVDETKAYERVRLSPRWAAAGVERATACAKYPASDGYVRYTYSLDSDEGLLSMEIAGNGTETELEILLPEGAEPTGVTVDGEDVPDPEITEMEGSRYLRAPLTGLGAHTVIARLE